MPDGGTHGAETSFGSLIRVLLLISGDDNRIRPGKNRCHMVVLEPPDHIRWRSIRGMHLGDQAALVGAIHRGALEYQPVTNFGLHVPDLPRIEDVAPFEVDRRR